MKIQYAWATDTASERFADVKNRLNANEPGLKSVFTQTFFEQAQQQCNELAAKSNSPLSGSLVSVKDLFDVKGFVTKAGTTFMAGDSPATTDAAPIKSLRDAGSILIGHTNMTELAYSGLGLNPHFGTPENALTPGCIPGGSTSGGAVSVAQGIADIAIGTDTGGSVRIPAAFNGIVGFKPSQNSVSRNGCKALSRTLDSVGPLARTVAACDIAYRTMSLDTHSTDLQVDKTLIVPTNYGMDERAEYNDAYQHKRDSMDPRIVGPTRMGRADEVDAITYRQTLNLRQQLIEQYQIEMGSKVLLMPTVPILPPSFLSLQNDEEYSRVNIQVLRNTSIANIMDCCSISLPTTHKGATIGVMMTVCNGHDLNLLTLASDCEKIL